MSKMKIFAVVLITIFIFFSCSFSENENDFIKPESRITFAVSPFNPPFEFIDPDTGQYTGIIIELLHKTGLNAGFEPVFRLMNQEIAKNSIISGKFDVFIDYEINVKNIPELKHTNPVLNVPLAIYVKSERLDITDLRHLNGKKTVLLQGDINKDFFLNLGIRPELLFTKEIGEAVDLLLQGSADALVANEQLLAYWLYKNDKWRDVKIAGEPIYTRNIVFSALESNAAILSVLEKGIIRSRENGEFESITKSFLGARYGSEKNEASFFKLVSVFITLFSSTLIAVVIAFYYARMCKNHLKIIKSVRDQLDLLNSEKDRFERDRLRLEERIIESQKAESLARFAGGMAHDFNNLLTAIMGEIDLAIVDLPENSSVRNSMKMAISIAQRAGNLAHRMLEYSGSDHTTMNVIDAGEAVREISGILRVSSLKNPEIFVDVDENLPGIKVNLGQFRQVMMNLVDNAVESQSGKSGIIKIHVFHAIYSPEELSGSKTGFIAPAGGYVTIEVKDEGSGIKPDIIEHIFEPFFTTKQSGRGLGLAAVVGIMRIHYGGIFVRSVPGEGSSFKILFPALKKQEIKYSSGLKLKTISEYPEAHAILIAEDEESVRNVVRRILESYGFKVISAVNGNDAVNKYSENPDSFAGLIIDLIMPGMNGIETMNAVREIRSDARIILTSAHDNPEVYKMMEEGLISGFIKKPYHLDNLKTILRNVFPSEF